MKDNIEQKNNLSFLALRITVGISVSANLSLPPEEVGHVIFTQAQEQINGFWALLFEDSQKTPVLWRKLLLQST